MEKKHNELSDKTHSIGGGGPSHTCAEKQINECLFFFSLIPHIKELESISFFGVVSHLLLYYNIRLISLIRRSTHKNDVCQ